MGLDVVLGGVADDINVMVLVTTALWWWCCDNISWVNVVVVIGVCITHTNVTVTRDAAVTLSVAWSILPMVCRIYRQCCLLVVLMLGMVG